MITVCGFYIFEKLNAKRLAALNSLLEEAKDRTSLRGLFILGSEGLNTTFSGDQTEVEDLVQSFRAFFSDFELTAMPKYSEATKQPFNEFKIKERDEIVTLERTDIFPTGTHRHLSPEKWNQALKEDVQLIDTRNAYETEIGTFKGAIDPKIDEFTEFGNFLENAELDKDKKTLIFCTGGIRCEKAIYEMEEKGFKNVYQLEGGILNYLHHHPNDGFDGECFVFDYRVAVDQNLKPTQQYRLCPHCGQPANQIIECNFCGREDTVCQVCLDKSSEYQTCSKNCAYHKREGHTFKNRHNDSLNKR